MKPSDLAVSMSSFFKILDDYEIPDEFVTDTTDNEATSAAHDANRAMAERMVAASLQAYAKKRYDKSKAKLIDLTSLAGGTEPEDGETKIIVYIDKQFTYEFRRNKSTTTVDSTKFLTELNRLGVSRATIEQAKKVATVEKAGASFHDISLTD